MNPLNNHLIGGEAFERLTQEKGAQVRASDYITVPDHLNRAARRALAGRTETTVSMHSGGQLSRWAADQRKQKRKAERAARKRNR